MKVVSIAIAALISAISAYVSFTVMSNIMLAYGLIALGFEAAKPFLIHVSAINYRAGNTDKAVIAGCVALMLCVVSVFASVSALESGVNTAKTKSVQYQQTTQQIDRLGQLAEKQRNANQITKASQTEKQITALVGSLPSSEAETVVTKNSMSVSVFISVMAELSVAAVLLCVPSSAENSARVHIENMTSNIQINALVNVRESILRGNTRPSFRGVAENFEGLRREDVRAMFNEMLTRGELKPHGKGYKLV